MMLRNSFLSQMLLFMVSWRGESFLHFVALREILPPHVLLFSKRRAGLCLALDLDIADQV
jgi:hypothetical protein